MIVVSKLDKPKHLKQVIHKDYRGNLTEIFLKKKLNLIFANALRLLQK